MHEKTLTVPELMLIAGTRVALGAGLGLVLADRLDDRSRRAAGLTLLAVGVLTTIPLAATVFHRADGDEQAHPKTRLGRRQSLATA
jgi:hypothetical protein